MVRKIIKINEDKCNGCGLCAAACHEGAIGMVGGKAKLLRDDYCDGLGNCLPVCPTGAITFEEREAAAFDEEAVKANAQKNNKQNHEERTQDMEHKNHSDAQPAKLACGCPGINSKSITHNTCNDEALASPTSAVASRLGQWPVQIKLVPPNAAYFKGANLLIAADCTAYAYGDFHNQFIKNKITLIGCPKLDSGDYAEKLTAILKMNDIKSVTIVRMEVPCCGGLEHAVRTALLECGKLIPWQVAVISTDGKILDN